MDNTPVTSIPTKKELRLLILGKSSYENRVVRNILTGQRDDVHTLLEKPETKTVKFERHGIQISVTDTPGLQDSEISLGEVKKNIEYALRSKLYENGFHAVLVVHRFPVRWTPEEKETFEAIRDLIHEKNISSNGVVIMTNSKGLLTESSMETDSNLCPEDQFEKYLEEERDITTRGFSDVLSLVKKVYFLEYTSKDIVYKRQTKGLMSSVSNNRTFSLYQHSLIIYTSPTYWLEKLFRGLYYIPLIGSYLYDTYTHWSVKDDVTIDWKSYDMLEDVKQDPVDELHMNKHGEEYIKNELDTV